MSTSSLWEYAHSFSPAPPSKRMVIKLSVTDLSTTTPFYQHLLNLEPTLQTAERIEFETDDPAVRIILMQSTNHKSCAGHYGFQMKSTRFIEQTRFRLLEKGFRITNEDNVACCYAGQTKLWVADPEGNRWEFFVTTVTEVSEGCGPDCICHQQLDRTLLSA